MGYIKNDHFKTYFSNAIFPTKKAIEPIPLIIKNKRTGCDVKRKVIVPKRAHIVEIPRNDRLFVGFCICFNCSNPASIRSNFVRISALVIPFIILDNNLVSEIGVLPLSHSLIMSSGVYNYYSSVSINQKHVVKV